MLQLSGNTLQQVEKFKYLGVVFTSDQRHNKIDARVGKTNAVLGKLYHSVVTERKLLNMAELSFMKSASVPISTWGHEGNDRKSTISSISGRDRTFAMSPRRVGSRQSAQLWNSWNPECRATSPNRDPSYDGSATSWLLTRMSQEMSTRRSSAGYTYGKRPRGRPRTRWREYISWSHLGVEPAELSGIAENHEVYFESLITGFVLTNYVPIIPKAISCSVMNNHNNINFSVSSNHHPISKQSSLKYFGLILDNKLNWKSQIKKLVTQLSKSCGMLFKLKHYTNISVLKSVYFALFHSYLTYSINWGRANKTTLLPLIRLHNKAARTLEYEQLKQPYSIPSTKF